MLRLGTHDSNVSWKMPRPLLCVGCLSGLLRGASRRRPRHSWRDLARPLQAAFQPEPGDRCWWLGGRSQWPDLRALDVQVLFPSDCRFGRHQSQPPKCCYSSVFAFTMRSNLRPAFQRDVRGYGSAWVGTGLNGLLVVRRAAHAFPSPSGPLTGRWTRPSQLFGALVGYIFTDSFLA